MKEGSRGRAKSPAGVAARAGAGGGKGKRGTDSYATYLDRVHALRTAPRPARVARCWAFVATCSGSERLSRTIGLPLAHVGVAVDPASEVQRLSWDHHGGCVPRHPCDDPFETEVGWDDWRLLHLGQHMARDVRLGQGVTLEGGCLALTFDRRVPLSEVRSSVAAALGRMGMNNAATTGEAVLSRARYGGPPIVGPRYAKPRSPGAAHRRVDDIYVFDPRTSLPLFGTLIDGALLRALASFVPSG